jgi:hypothetical protein
LSERAATEPAPRGLLMCKAMTISAVAVALGLLAAASAQARWSPDAPIVLAQGGFTFGSRDDLGPRYDPYSERWDQHEPAEMEVCRWLAVRTALPDGKVALRRQRVCGFKVPARD